MAKKQYSAPGTFFRWLMDAKPQVRLLPQQLEIAQIINEMPIGAGKTFLINLLKEWDDAGAK